MSNITTREENEFYFPFGLSLHKEATALYSKNALFPLRSHDAAVSRSQYAQLLAHQYNDRLAAQDKGMKALRSGELMGIMLLHEIYRFLLTLYTKTEYPDTLDGGIGHVKRDLGLENWDDVLNGFIDYYPPRSIIEEQQSRQDYKDGVTNEWAHIKYTLLEMFILRVDHENPALKRYVPLFDDEVLQKQVPLYRFIQSFERWFDVQPLSPALKMTLFDILREPIRRCPDSLEGQLNYLINRYRDLLPASLIEGWILIQGVMREESFFRGTGPGPIPAHYFDDAAYAEPEAFSRDEDWMPNVVLLAKLAYVWLDQLSKKYNRHLRLLSDIPDEELDQLASWGINALWLIGVWERSPASQNIKQRMGNPEAAASAYSLYDYTISADLGGEHALQELTQRARQRGIRLAGDMVPNHMGIYSKWITDHPERFLQLDAPPYPAYRFDGPDLSEDGRVGIFIEDGYWSHQDAAVVFKHVDRHTGKERFIYHGNDGTSMPWNDTAQLDFMREDTREAVIQTILEVARRFPVIRFDAAMTLAKKHYQRLWFPKAGDAGAIPSRAAFSMDRAEFDRLFPHEFWREVVDRVAAEAPDTLLLAEAFWLMEGYFVRTLGMHRVYNSAFMNMLKMEDNGKFRQTIKNVLEFSPAVLQRFVNFMNNPDEDTAIAQFGKGDKYFGVATLLVTLPGLPMFGHGQIEGLTEKYGMEYRRAYKEEQADRDFVQRHERDIFPLARKRYVFSGAAQFAFYDFTVAEGWVDENVIAYSNHNHDEHAFVVYNNAYTTTLGTLHRSTAINEGRGDETILRHATLAESLHLDTDRSAYVIWRDVHSGLEYLHHCESLHQVGLNLELHAYESKVFFVVRQLRDQDNSWGRLHGKLAGTGVPSVDEAYLELRLEGILDPFRAFMCADMLRHVMETEEEAHILGPWQEKLEAFLDGVNQFTGEAGVSDNLTEKLNDDLRSVLQWSRNAIKLPLPEAVTDYLAAYVPGTHASPDEKLRFWQLPLVFCILRRLAETRLSSKAAEAEHSKASADESASDDPLHAAEKLAHTWMSDWLLIKPVTEAFTVTSGDGWRAQQDAHALSQCLAHRGKLLQLDTEIWGSLLYDFFENEEMRRLLMVHRYAQKRWINKEEFERVMFLLFLTHLAAFNRTSVPDVDSLLSSYENLQEIVLALSDTGYDIDWALHALN